MNKTIHEKTNKNIEPEADNARKGDILLLQAGDLVSADVKLIEANGLEVDEFELTGEIMPVKKEIGKGKDINVYNGSRVIRGHAKGVVIATGAKTEYGEILSMRYRLVKRKNPPLLKKRFFLLPILLIPHFLVDFFIAGDLLRGCLIHVAIAFFLVFIQNSELFKYILLSREVEKLQTKHVQFHDETVLEVFDSLDVICFDKTGVLTTQDLEVKQVHLANGTPDKDSRIFDLIRNACALCNDIVFLEKIKHADPLDRAMLSFASRNGVDIYEIKLKYRRIYEEPFDSERRYMASGFELVGDKKKLFLVKGDPEIIMKMCKTYITCSGDEKEIDLDFMTAINPKNESLNGPMAFPGKIT
ncbi:MAG: hypothetical protein Q6373_025110 [Candidatus Sigynarchaeota archaeon]